MENFVLFSHKWNLRNVFELKFWHEKLSSFDENFFKLLTDYCYDWIFFFFLRFMSMFWTNLKKKKLKIWTQIPKMFNFWNFICGSTAEISTDRPKIASKIFFCPKLSPKQFWIKSEHYIIKTSKKLTPPRNGHFGGSHFICGLSQCFKLPIWMNDIKKW